MFERAALVHYHELGLKGRNRSIFERRLQANLQAALGQLTEVPVERVTGRLVARASDSSAMPAIIDALRLVPGVSSVSPSWVTTRDAEDMNRAASLAMDSMGEFQSFRVSARRSNTDHAVTSLQMNVEIGQHLVDSTGKSVVLGRPDVEVHVEVVQGEVYVYAAKIPGPGGLPVGTAGKVISLISAGIDSPVASWRIARRGAVVVGLHFSGRPQTNDLSERLVVELGEVLATHQAMARIYIVPFGDLQKEISLGAPPALRVLLYRRLMIKVAERLAATENAKALVTGESLGQVASQTLENIAAVDEAATLPVLRPLIGHDKLEIIGEARRLGTFELSTIDHADCCTLFMPRSPATHARVADVLAAEESLDIERMVTDALASMTHFDFAHPSYRPPKSRG
ncbi:MAG: tRNA uracil 4-sulfurtransferase ThiI [Coriobacteriia bacterium]|nr:tRNA uracil 4-sulfurtransferase ThiI [Coriobacteriia bacterium]